MARKSTPRRARTTTTTTDKVVVRMYRVGFGDCFLVLIPDGTQTRRILIDCGSIKRDPHLKKSAGDISRQVIKDVTDTDGTPRVDVLIATHRHKDHVGGFADDVWDSVEVGEVWMPWTESDADPAANRLRAMQENVAQRLTEQLTAAGKLGLAGLAANARSNAAAMARLKTGFKSRTLSKPRYLGAGPNDPKTITTPHLPGVTVHVLGPPRDEKVISKDLPADHDELYLKLGAGGVSDPDTASSLVRPFGPEWVVENPSYRLDEGQLKKLRNAVRFDPEAVLAAIDDSLNNTSLVLVLEVGGRFLLFPGDAQWGPWKEILANDDAVALLRKTSFYKTGHHASHNATPRKFVEEVVGKESPVALTTMVSVTEHGSYRDIPRQPLMDALQRRFDNVAISSVTGNQDGFVRSTKWSIDFEFEAE